MITSTYWDRAIQAHVIVQYPPHAFELDDWDGKLVHAMTYRCHICGLPEDVHQTIQEQVSA